MTASLLVEHFDDLLATPEDVEILNRAILYLAVKGKLVAQDSEDEPAEELLNRISGAKERIKNVGNFELPKGWAWSCLQEVVTEDKHAIKRGPFGSAIKKAYFVLKGYKIYEQGNAIYKDFNRGDYYINEEKFQALKSFEIKPHDIIISCSGTVGKMAIVPEGIEPGIINQALLKLSINQEALLNEYFEIILPAYIMKTDTLTDLKGTAIKNITSVKILRSLPFPLPPFSEQKRIVGRVKELFVQTRALAKELAYSQIELDGLNKSALSHLLASETPEEFKRHWEFIAEHFDLLFQAPEHVAPLRQSILELAVRGKLTRREAGDDSGKELLKRIQTEREKLGKNKPAQLIDEGEHPFDIPDEWEWVRLGDLVNKLGAGSTPTGGREVYTNSGTKFIRSQNVWNDGLSLDGVAFISETINEKMSGTIVKAKDILLNITGASIARCALVPDDFDSANVNQHVMIIRLVEPEIRKFIHICMISPYIYDLIMSVQVGVSREGLSIGKLEKFVLPFPPLAEQERIVKRVEQLLGLCDALEARLQSAEEERGRLVESVLARVGS